MFKKLAFCPSPHVRTRPRVHRAPLAHRQAAHDHPFSAISVCDRQMEPAKSADYQGSLMPEVIFTGPAGRLEGRYHPAKQKNAPIAMVLHPHPQFHGTINHQIIYQCYYAFALAAFRCCASIPRRRPQPGLVRSRHRRIVRCGLRARLGADHQSRSARLLGRRLLVRRLDRHAAFDAPSGSRRFHLDRAARNRYDFSFLAPCPSSGLIVHGEKDIVAPAKDVNTLVEKLKTQKGIVIDQQIIPGANHFFDDKMRAADGNGDRLSRHAARERPLKTQRACTQ